MRFARVVTGGDGVAVALDCIDAASADDLAKCFHPDWLAKNQFTAVPDGTMHGARSNGNGTFANPSPAVLPIPPEPQPSQIEILQAKIDAVAQALNVDVSAAVAALKG